MVIFALVVLGLIFGSFVNALAWRLHKGRNWVSERSECVNCHHKLDWQDLIPVISWLQLRGKCRYCHKPIDDSPITELVTAALFAGSYLYWPYELNGLWLVVFALWLVILVGFMAMTVSDLKWMTLPNQLTFTFFVISMVLVVLMSVAQKDGGVLIGAIGGLAAVAGLFYGLFQLSDGKWIGGGDVKLALALGALAGGFMEGLLLIFIASTLGSLVSAPLLMTTKGIKNRKIPFGPFLMAAGVIVFLFGQRIIDWYQSLILM